MIRLTRDELLDVLRTVGHNEHAKLAIKVAEAQVKKALISIGKEAKRMDGKTYWVPDYAKYRQAVKEAGIESAS